MLVTTSQLSRRAEVYRQLSQMTAAGIGLPQAIEMQYRAPPAPSFRDPLARVIERLSNGATFHEAMQSTGRWVPAFDLALLDAGERSGRLPNCFKLLAEHYENATALLRKTIASLVYPALLFHMAIFLGPLPDLFRTGNVPAYVVRTLGLLVPLYGGIAALLYAMQGQHGESWRSLMEHFSRRIPVVGKARHHLALARLASALEALITAGVTLFEAWDLAAAASGSPALRRAVSRWKPQFQSGVTPAEAVRESREFPELFAKLYHTGEVTGSLDET